MAEFTFEIYDKYWNADDKAAIRKTIDDLLAKEGCVVESINMQQHTLPQRTVVVITGPSKAILFDHDKIKNEIETARAAKNK